MSELGRDRMTDKHAIFVLIDALIVLPKVLQIGDLTITTRIECRHLRYNG
jgi:hypothetical protein